MLKTLQPIVLPEEYVYVTSAETSDSLSKMVPNATVKETEGLTYVVTKSEADTLNLPYSFVAKWITL